MGVPFRASATSPLPTITIPSITTTSTSTLLPLPTITLPGSTTALLSVTTTSIATSTTTSSTLLALPDFCLTGTCDDGNACTADTCDALLGCTHTPLDTAACRPDEPGSECRLGVGACTDDGFSCTDEVCTVAGCLHVPVDSRCVAATECTTAACRPSRPDRDAAGCVTGASRAEGETCAEDADPCTLDVCRSAVCAHAPVVEPGTCVPVRGPFQQAIALESLSESLLLEVAVAAPTTLSERTAAFMTARLERARDSLGAAAQALAGDVSDGIAPLAAGGAIATDIGADERARIAFTKLLHTPRAIGGFLRLLANARSLLEERVARDLARDGRRLLKGTKALKSQLQGIRRGSLDGASRRHRRG